MKRNKVIIISLVILEVVTASFLSLAWYQGMFWKFDATHYAGQAGYLEAEQDYRKGKRRILEVVIIDSSKHDYSGPAYMIDEMKPANRKDGIFDVWQIIESPDLPQTHRATLNEYVSNYNRAMRVRIEHPEWYTPEGERIPKVPAKAARNEL